MQQYIIQRLVLTIPVLFLVVSLVFVATRVIQPGFAEQRAARSLTSTESFENAVLTIKRKIGTDKPLWKQYGFYLKDVSTFNFGKSLQTQQPVISELKSRLGPSIELGILQILIAGVISLPIGIIAAIRQDSWIDYVLRFSAVLGLAIPSFYLGTLMLIVSFKWLNWAPPLTILGYRGFFDDPVQNLQMMLLPALAGGFASAAIIMRLLRSQLLEVLREDYVRTAWAKGLRERTVITRHALKNALIPVLTILGLLVAILFGGNVILESMFSIPGAGQFIVISMQNNDFPVVQGLILIIAIVLVLTNLVIDISYAWLDPRIRYG